MKENIDDSKYINAGVNTHLQKFTILKML